MAISDVELAQSKNIAVEQVPLLRQSRGMTNESLEALSEDDVQQAIARLDHPDLPGGRHDPATGKIVGGAQDNGTLLFDPSLGTEAWSNIFGGDGGWCAVRAGDPTVYYGEYVYADIHRTVDLPEGTDTSADGVGTLTSAAGIATRAVQHRGRGK